MASSPAAVRELQQDLESQANALSKIQKDIAKNHQVRKQYTIQLGENELVLTELELLNENSNVYKLIGPVLVKQDIAEANANVRKRIEYISVELKRLDGTLQDSEDKQNSKKESVLQLQQKIQTLQAGKSKS
ncbi:prefoldin subunit 6-like [Musa acuminata AAA Group]|uniref:Prefoldin subunit 6 n=1 Tax=Musa acuminata subsp. malaccensis TaxID=214687 RepID=A0A804KW49_MUSAM